MIDEHCASCHSGDTKRVRFDDGKLRKDRELAKLVTWMVASNRMPPRPHTLATEERRHALATLCSVWSPSVDRCLAVVDPVSSAPFMMTSDEILRGIAAKAPRSGSEPGVGERMFTDHDKDAEVAAHLSPRDEVTYETALLLLAGERCQKRNDYRSCLESVLDRSRTLALPPAPTGAASASSQAGKAEALP